MDPKTKRLLQEMERRTNSVAIEARSEGEGGTTYFEGYALKFNQDSENLGWFTEKLDARCLDNTDMSNVVALYNHNPDYPLARSTVKEGAGKLELTVDAIGLKFKLTPTDTTYARDMVANMNAGVLNKCSFAFTTAEDGDSWEYDNDADTYRRTVTAIERLYDVSIVTTPAYEGTEVVAAQRSFDAFKKTLEERNQPEDVPEQQEQPATEEATDDVEERARMMRMQLDLI